VSLSELMGGHCLHCPPGYAPGCRTCG